MSKRSRRKQARKAEAARLRAEQQAALSAKSGAAVGQEGSGRPSIAALVLQRMDKLGVVQTVEQQASNGQTATAPRPSIKVTPSPDGKGMPTVHGPAPAPTPVPPMQEKWPDNWPAYPKTCDPMEWRRAIENKEYYELRQIEDDGKRPWFQYPRHPWQYSEFVYLTPEMAQALLEHMPINRPMKDSWVDAISRDVLNERWLQTHESIAINRLGDLPQGKPCGFLAPQLQLAYLDSVNHL
jgi:hypothetical protein